MTRNEFTSTRAKIQHSEMAGMQMNEFDGAQREKLRSIAEYLRQERQNKDISLEEIAVKTFIPLRLLQAIDIGQIERLPEPVFVQGFIRRYADALGLDGWAVAKTFPTQPTVTEPVPVESGESVSAPPPQDERLEPVIRPSITPISPPQTTRFPGSTVLLGGVAVVLGGLILTALLNRPKSEPASQQSQVQEKPIATKPSPSSSPIARSSTPKPSASPSPSPKVSSTVTSEPNAMTVPSPVSGPVEVAVDLKDGDSWMEVVVDGKTEFEGTLKKGEQKTWTAQKKIVLTSGNAGAVYASYNQGEEKKLGSVGEVKDVTFPPAEPKSSPQTAPSPATNN